jgi:hypothetical protein
VCVWVWVSSAHAQVSFTNHIALLLIDIFGAERSTTSEAIVTSSCDTSLVLQSTRWISFDWILTAEQVCQDKNRATIARPQVTRVSTQSTANLSAQPLIKTSQKASTVVNWATFAHHSVDQDMA